MRLEEYITSKDIELIHKTIDGVVKRLMQDAESMSIDPRHCNKTENIVDCQRFIANWIDKDRGDIIYDTFGIDLDEEKK